jgi:hypothetical protein
LTIVCLAVLAGTARGDSRGSTTLVSPPIGAEIGRAAETEALHAILEDGRGTVESLTATLASLPPGRDRDRIQADIIAAKLDARERMLRAIISFATARGDLREAEEADLALEALRAPVIRATTVSPATKEGGAQ